MVSTERVPNQPASKVRPVAAAKPMIHTTGDAENSIFKTRVASAQVSVSAPSTPNKPAAPPNAENSAINALRIWLRVPPNVRINAVS